MPGGEHDSRKKQFKNAGKHEEMRRRRAEGSLELRKAKKEDALMKRRNFDATEDDTDYDLAQLPSDSDTNEAAVANGHGDAGAKHRPPSVEACIEAIRANPTDETLIALNMEWIRRILSKSQTPPVTAAINAGVLPLIIAGLNCPNSAIQMDSAWAATNIVSGSSSETRAGVEAGLIPPLILLLSSQKLEIAEQAIWALGNIIGESGEYRDLVVKAGVIEGLMRFVHLGPQLSIVFLRTIAWTVSNLCRHKEPRPALSLVAQILPFVQLLLTHSDTTVVADTCWGLSYLSDGPDTQVDLVLSSDGVLPALRRFLSASMESGSALLAPTLRSLGNFVTGTDQHTQAVIDAGVLGDELKIVLDESSKNSLRKEACWLLSNVIAGTQAQIQTVIDAGFLLSIVNCLDNGDAKTQFEASWCLANLGQGGRADQIQAMVDAGAIMSLCRVLDGNDPRMIGNILDTLQAILNSAETYGAIERLEKVQDAIEEAGGLDHLERLQQNANQQIYEKAIYIIETYFHDDEQEMEDKENCQPSENFTANQAPSGGFKF